MFAVTDIPDSSTARSIPAPTVERRMAEASKETIERSLHYLLIEEMRSEIEGEERNEAELRADVGAKLAEMLDRAETPLSASGKREVIEDVVNNVLGYGPIEPLLRDPTVTEIMVNDADTIYVERAGKIYLTEKRFMDEEHLRRIIDKIVAQVGRRMDESSPMLDARLPDGSRVNVIISPPAVDGSMLAIRKLSTNPYTVEDLIAFGTLSPEVAELLEACVLGRLNIIVSGASGAGKTTLLNVLSAYIPSDERIVTIEDAAELRLHQPHVLRLESRPPSPEGTGQVTIRDLVCNSLRMRPDRVIVGEICGAEAADVLQAMNTRHDGSLSTVHANSPRDALTRIETMVLMAGCAIPMQAVRQQASSALDLIVHMGRLRDGSRRIMSMSEVTEVQGDAVAMSEIASFDYSPGVGEDGRFLGRLKFTGTRPEFCARLDELGIEVPEDVFEYEPPERG